MINDACSTCSAVGEHGGSFCVRTLRKGALAYIGALNIAGVSTVYEEIINNIYHHGMSLAEAYTLAYSSTHYSTPYAALLGDPALNMNNPYLLNDAIMIDCND